MPTWLWITAASVLAGFLWFSWWGRQPYFVRIQDPSKLEDRLRQLAQYGHPLSLVRVKVKDFAGQIVIEHADSGLCNVTFPPQTWTATDLAKVSAHLTLAGFHLSRAESGLTTSPPAMIARLELPAAALATLSALDAFHLTPATADIRASIEGPFDLLEQHRTFIADIRALRGSTAGVASADRSDIAASSLLETTQIVC